MRSYITDEGPGQLIGFHDCGHMFRPVYFQGPVKQQASWPRISNPRPFSPLILYRQLVSTPAIFCWLS